MPDYSYCETVAAYVMHIRELTQTGRHLGGGADTSALCGGQAAWDIATPVEDPHRGRRMCVKCAEEYRNLVGSQDAGS